MSSHHLNDDVCLDYLNDELSAAEMASFESHVSGCSECRRTVQEYEAILKGGLLAVADEDVDRLMVDAVPWSIDHGVKRLYAAVQTEHGAATSLRHAKRKRELVPGGIPLARLANSRIPSYLRVSLAVAASLILAFALGLSAYRIGLKRGQRQSRVVRQSDNDDATLRSQVEKLANERAQIEALLRERATAITGLRAQLKEQREEIDALEGSLVSANAQKDDTEVRIGDISSQRDELIRKLDDERANAAAAQTKIDSLQRAETNDALRVVNLENQIQQMAQLSKDRAGTIDEQERFLAEDRDIRDLITARNLYIAELYDVGGNGKRKKAYGRVFYTKGKSLIFYAYDLDQEPELKDASTFQAWGLRGPDRNTALSLGVMYLDSSTNKRWVMRCDDVKALEQINAVFLTVEPKGGSRTPRGPQVLGAAYLREEPNHP